MPIEKHCEDCGETFWQTEFNQYVCDPCFEKIMDHIELLETVEQDCQ